MYTGGRGNTVIDYVLENEGIWEKIERLEIGEDIDSDHHPVICWIKGEVGGMEEKIEKMNERIKKALEESEKGKGKEEKKKGGWWNKERIEKKKEVRLKLRKWWRGEEERGRYGEEKREYKEMCERKKKEEGERLIKEAGEARTESKVWEIVNRERRKRKGVEEGIQMKEWKEYFMGLLGGVEKRVRRGRGGRNRREMEREIEWEEINKIMSNLRLNKAMGLDNIPNEVWRYWGEDIRKWIWETCNKVWRGEGWPEGWKEGIIAPIVNKGEGDKVTDYRGVTLMSMLYKIYTSILAERLREEVEEKGIIPENQTGFRKGRGVMDNIYVLNYLAQRQISKEKKKLISMFIDLKAAFDSVDRGVLVRALRERGVREGLIEKIEEVIGETKSRVRIGEEISEEFWTGRGVRQGCPLSPMLFNIVIADMEEKIARGKWGGVKLGERKMFSMAYADDIVLLTEEEDEMRAMLARTERYMDNKRLEVNVLKTKIMVFRKGGGKRKRVKWMWKGKRIEEVKEIKYLGYVFQANGRQDGHVKDRVRKAVGIMGQVWSIGKRKFGKDIGKRTWLFDALVWTVLSYGAEVWGWKERDKVEKVEERFLKWLLGVDRRTPGYMVREELKRDKLRSRAARRAWNFEKRLEEGKGGGLARECLEEIKKRSEKGRGVSEWEKDRERYFRETGLEELAWNREGEGGMIEYEEAERKDKELQREERKERIEESRFNRWYKRIKSEGTPEYLKRGWSERRWGRMTRFRLGNEMRESRYWESEEKKVCRVCNRERETWEHVWVGCGRGEGEGEESWQEAVERILGEEGEGKEWMKKVLRRRGDRAEGREGEEERE